MRLLGGTIVSSEERCAKPDPQIYAIAIERFGLKPEQAMFFDDKFENARAATEAGMHGVRFLDAGQALQAVRDAR